VKRIYEILIYAGWIWAAAVGLFLIIKLHRRQDARGFEIMERHEK
jgi:hypothetical protein